jgi:hypothetical protein
MINTLLKEIENFIKSRIINTEFTVIKLKNSIIIESNKAESSLKISFCKETVNIRVYGKCKKFLLESNSGWSITYKSIEENRNFFEQLLFYSNISISSFLYSCEEVCGNK